MLYNISEAQNIFNTVVAHLRSQGKKAAERDICKFRTSDGLKCAVGCLIPDNVYSTEIEGQYLIDVIRELIPQYESYFDLLQGLQRVHDGYPAAKWEEGLVMLAGHFGLILPSKP